MAADILAEVQSLNNSPELSVVSQRERLGDRFPNFCAACDGAAQIPRIKQIESPLKAYPMQPI
jgi:hypothetical protein